MSNICSANNKHIAKNIISLQCFPKFFCFYKYYNLQATQYIKLVIKA